MRTIYLILITFWFHSLFGFSNKIKIDTALLPDYQLTLASEDQVFELPTPDYLAFTDTVLTKGKGNNGLAKYNGYGKAIKNGLDWKSGCIFQLKNKSPNSQDTCWISLLVFHKTTNVIIQSLGISLIDFEIGKNIILENELKSKQLFQNESDYADVLENGCATATTYYVDERYTSFIRIVDYNKDTKLLKARFKIHLKLHSIDDNDVNEKDFPKEILFDDGIIYAINLAE